MQAVLSKLQDSIIRCNYALFRRQSLTGEKLRENCSMNWNPLAVDTTVALGYFSEKPEYWRNDPVPYAV